MLTEWSGWQSFDRLLNNPSRVPDQPGIYAYALADQKRESGFGLRLLYVGQAESLFHRWRSYRRDLVHVLPQDQRVAYHMCWLEAPLKELSALEKAVIGRCRPHLNSHHRNSQGHGPKQESAAMVLQEHLERFAWEPPTAPIPADLPYSMEGLMDALRTSIRDRWAPPLSRLGRLVGATPSAVSGWAYARVPPNTDKLYAVAQLLRMNLVLYYGYPGRDGRGVTVTSLEWLGEAMEQRRRDLDMDITTIASPSVWQKIRSGWPVRLDSLCMVCYQLGLVLALEPEQVG